MFASYFSPIYYQSIGASGAIFGLFGALAMVSKKIGANLQPILVIIGINFAMDFVIKGIDWKAHLGGLIGGALASQLVLTRR